MYTNNIAHAESEVKGQNGVKGVDVRTFYIYVSGQHVTTIYGSEWQAWDEYQEWNQAIADDPAVDLYANTPIAEIPDSYWKNGSTPILEVA